MTDQLTNLIARLRRGALMNSADYISALDLREAADVIDQLNKVIVAARDALDANNEFAARLILKNARTIDV